eukprot:1865404-Heterocapsa_arctica.AAC.1
MPPFTSAASCVAGWPLPLLADLRKKGSSIPGAAQPSATACPAAPLPLGGRGATPQRCNAASHGATSAPASPRLLVRGHGLPPSPAPAPTPSKPSRTPAPAPLPAWQESIGTRITAHS